MPNVSIKPLSTDEKPTKYRVEVGPQLQEELELYGQAYAEEYGTEPKIAELLPVMIEQFLAKDREFKRFKKEKKKTQSTPSSASSAPASDTDADSSTY